MMEDRGGSVEWEDYLLHPLLERSLRVTREGSHQKLSVTVKARAMLARSPVL